MVINMFLPRCNGAGELLRSFPRCLTKLWRLERNMLPLADWYKLRRDKVFFISKKAA